MFVLEMYITKELSECYKIKYYLHFCKSYWLIAYL